MDTNDYGTIFAGYLGLNVKPFELEYTMPTIISEQDNVMNKNKSPFQVTDDGTDGYAELYDSLIYVFANSGVSAIEAVYNIRRANGEDVILTPDDQIIEITDAPAIEFTDGRKYKQDGTVY